MRISFENKLIVPVVGIISDVFNSRNSGQWHYRLLLVINDLLNILIIRQGLIRICHFLIHCGLFFNVACFFLFILFDIFDVYFA